MAITMGAYETRDATPTKSALGNLDGSILLR